MQARRQLCESVLSIHMGAGVEPELLQLHGNHLYTLSTPPTPYIKGFEDKFC